MNKAIDLQFAIMDKVNAIITASSNHDHEGLRKAVQDHANLLGELRMLAQDKPESGYLHTLGGKEEATDRLQMQPEEEQ